jgi:FG-GAP repeat/FG-GAP-like repeat
MRRRHAGALSAATVLLATGLVCFGPASPAAAATCHNHVSHSDFNGDGIDDVAAAAFDGHGRVHVLYGTSAGLTATSPDDTLFTTPNKTTFYYGQGQSIGGGDFNGDGCTDLAVADPFGTLNGNQYSGVVTLFKGTPDGLTTTTNQLNAQSGGGTVTSYAHFGVAMAVGDINNDGRDDLVVGADGEDAIYVFFGTASGLSTGKRYAEGHSGVPGEAGSYSEFGYALAIGDFNGDRHDDVAIGAPYEDDGSVGGAGAVVVLRGATSGSALTTDGAQIWSQGSAGVPGVAESDDEFGAALATGYFKDGPTEDLAIGSPYETIDGVTAAGAVNVLYSSGNGLTSAGAQVFDEGNPALVGAPDFYDNFGWSLTSGLFNAGAGDELAIGIPERTVNGSNVAGAVLVLSGSLNGITTSGSQEITQATPGIGGTPNDDDEFGLTLTTVIISAFPEQNLVVGSPGETDGSIDSAGMISLISGSATGLTGTGSQTWREGTSGVKGAECDGCAFGSGLA